MLQAISEDEKHAILKPWDVRFPIEELQEIAQELSEEISAPIKLTSAGNISKSSRLAFADWVAEIYRAEAHKKLKALASLGTVTMKLWPAYSSTEEKVAGIVGPYVRCSRALKTDYQNMKELSSIAPLMQELLSCFIDQYNASLEHSQQILDRMRVAVHSEIKLINGDLEWHVVMNFEDIQVNVMYENAVAYSVPLKPIKVSFKLTFPPAIHERGMLTIRKNLLNAIRRNSLNVAALREAVKDNSSEQVVVPWVLILDLAGKLKIAGVPNRGSPYISGNGECCFGDFKDIVPSLASLKVPEAVHWMKEWLQTYKAPHERVPYNNIWQFYMGVPAEYGEAAEEEWTEPSWCYNKHQPELEECDDIECRARKQCLDYQGMVREASQAVELSGVGNLSLVANSSTDSAWTS